MLCLFLFYAMSCVLPKSGVVREVLWKLGSKRLLMSLLVPLLAARGLIATSPAEKIRKAWDSGKGATELRPLVEAAAPSVHTAAAEISGSPTGWGGLWLARIEHFEKLKFSGLRVNPHYDLSDDGSIISHVHIVVGPLKVWASASGCMEPASDGKPTVRLLFDDFWISGDDLKPRDAPVPQAGGFDGATRWLGRALFFEGLADFPVDYVDMASGIVAFRFTPLNSCIVSRRVGPAGSPPQRCAE